ncbi:MAG: Holliday junction resolvase RuvX, partial [Mogibacterium sp.]|nr:Holliday junction resolvase RuvX [Mogibacterium sp.]
RVEWQDERYSTVEAEEVLIEANMSREDRKKIIDRQAAIVILQRYLDRMHS